MRLSPARGLVLVKPVETQETFEGSSIVLLPETRNRLTLGQFEVVAVGKGAVCKDYFDCPRSDHTTDRSDVIHLPPVVAGEWVLMHFRDVMPAALDEERTYLARQEHISAVVESS